MKEESPGTPWWFHACLRCPSCWKQKNPLICSWKVIPFFPLEFGNNELSTKELGKYIYLCLEFAGKCCEVRSCLPFLKEKLLFQILFFILCEGLKHFLNRMIYKSHVGWLVVIWDVTCWRGEKGIVGGWRPSWGHNTTSQKSPSHSACGWAWVRWPWNCWWYLTLCACILEHGRGGLWHHLTLKGTWVLTFPTLSQFWKLGRIICSNIDEIHLLISLVRHCLFQECLAWLCDHPDLPFVLISPS